MFSHFLKSRFLFQAVASRSSRAVSPMLDQDPFRPRGVRREVGHGRQLGLIQLLPWKWRWKELAQLAITFEIKPEVCIVNISCSSLKKKTFRSVLRLCGSLSFRTVLCSKFCLKSDLITNLRRPWMFKNSDSGERKFMLIQVYISRLSHSQSRTFQTFRTVLNSCLSLI